MIKFLSVLALCGMLAACAGGGQPTLTVTKRVAVVPPASIMQCHVASLPKEFKSNKEVAGSLVKLYGTNVKCKNNMDAVRDFEQKAKETVGE